MHARDTSDCPDTSYSRSKFSRENCDAIVRELQEIYSWNEFSYAIKDFEGSCVHASHPYAAQESLEPIGCVAKAYTAMLVTEIFGRHGISLDRPVIEIISEFGVKSTTASRSITIRHLLSHSSGMDTEGMVGFPTVESGFFERLKHVDQLFAPGDGSSYCSSGFTVAACAIERVAGRRWEQLLVEPPKSPRSNLLASTCQPIISSGAMFVPQRGEGHICEAASLGRSFALSVSEIANFGIRCLSPQYAELRRTVLWPDGECGYCACGTAGGINTRVQVIPELGLSIAARVNGPESDSVVLHDFFRKLIGSQWNGFVRPTGNTGQNRASLVIEGRYRCAFIDMLITRVGNAVIADTVVGVAGEETWIGWSSEREEIRLEWTSSGALAGSISVGPDPFPFVLEPLVSSAGLQYLIFNRKMLLRRV